MELNCGTEPLGRMLEGKEDYASHLVGVVPREWGGLQQRAEV